MVSRLTLELWNLVTVCLIILFVKIMQNTKIMKFISMDFLIITILVFLIFLFSISFIQMNSKIVERAKISILKKK